MDAMNIGMTVYFEIKAAELYGGANSIGYMKTEMEFTVSEEKPQMFKESAYDFAKTMMIFVAEELGVPVENIKTITKEEYMKRESESKV